MSLTCLLLQPAYGSRLVTSLRGHVTRVVCVPAFSAAGEAVLVDLGSLDTRVLAFMLNNEQLVVERRTFCASDGCVWPALLIA